MTTTTLRKIIQFSILTHLVVTLIRTLKTTLTTRVRILTKVTVMKRHITLMVLHQPLVTFTTVPFMRITVPLITREHTEHRRYLHPTVLPFPTTLLLQPIKRLRTTVTREFLIHVIQKIPTLILRHPTRVTLPGVIMTIQTLQIEVFPTTMFPFTINFYVIIFWLMTIVRIKTVQKTRIVT